MARRKSSIADDLVLLPWWVSVALAGAAYLILPGLLPTPMVKTGIAGVVAIGLLAIAVISALRAWSNWRMLEGQTGLDSIRSLPWKRFEDLLGEAYRRQGYKVEETLGGGADGGVDLTLRRNGEITLVQCKRWKGKPVPVQIVRELYGVLHDRRASAAKLVATAHFTPEAIAFAKGKPIELVNAESLVALVQSVQASGNMTSRSCPQSTPSPVACPQCGTVMVKRTARKGPNAGSEFWDCTKYPGCRGTREI